MSKLRLIEKDPYLEPFREYIESRRDSILNTRAKLCNESGSLSDFANGHNYFGMHMSGDLWVFREWAPNASSIILTGDFNNWEKQPAFKFKKTSKGEFELKVPREKIRHLDQYKLWIEWPGGADFRIPLYARRVIQDPETKLFNAQVWYPEEQFKWTSIRPERKDNEALLIYEAHVGMGTSEEKVGTYSEFTLQVLPRIKKLGYNALQLMAIQEHPYYGSFGYHVSNFFAPSSRFGTPEDLKILIDTAHGMGIVVIMDIVHSHAVKNVLEGPGLFDGKPGMLFHTDHRREHSAWDSLCFDYGREETIHFLLSNCKYWLEEFRFDGFRFDGVTSMLYFDHGLGKSFSSYDDYFTGNTDPDASRYLGLANLLIHEINPGAVTVAEDMSGMPGLGIPVGDGGLGFDYRLAMGVPDFWIKMIKERKDEDWNVDEIFFELTNYRSDEKSVSYCESHDQALVGDKTIIFRLADREMYTHMSKFTPSLIIDRALALHKMIRLITIATNGGGYLNFMGNEFGHPEWIDFPREGNGWSYKYARRQWELADDQSLKYGFLERFDMEMVRLVRKVQFIPGNKAFKNHSNPFDQVIAFEQGDYLFVFNFNPVKSFTDYGIPSKPADYKIILSSDSPETGGFDRVDTRLIYEPERTGPLDSGFILKLYLPSRAAMVLKSIPIRKAK
jgi:1,4-alpha-glucan branching enzyme